MSPCAKEASRLEQAIGLTREMIDHPEKDKWVGQRAEEQEGEGQMQSGKGGRGGANEKRKRRGQTPNIRKWQEAR